jgi:voltage-gated potassium channel
MAGAGIMTKHVQLLTALVAMELVQPLMAEAKLAARILAVALFALVCVAVFRALFNSKRLRRLGTTLAVVAIAIDLARVLVPAGLQLSTDVAMNVASTAFFVFVLSVIVSHVFGTRQLRIDDVVGAFSGYIVIAVIWGRLYALAWLIVPGSFRISPYIRWQLNDWSMLHALFDYYSFTTISGLGYGAITTTGPASNTLVWLEVMCGQFYLAVVVASIVAIKVAQVLAAARDGS